MVYEGNEPYIFVSYSHLDGSVVIPIIDSLQGQGFRVWYDSGIEPGTEWPEFIAEHLDACRVFLSFISGNAISSSNCQQEIHRAIHMKKDVLVAYLEQTQLSPGMEMRLGPLQAMKRWRHSSDSSFAQAIAEARLLQPCKMLMTGYSHARKITFNAAFKTSGFLRAKAKPEESYRNGPISVDGESSFFVLASVINDCEDVRLSAEDVRIAMQTIQIDDHTVDVECEIYCSNATPQTCDSRIRFVSNDPFSLEYVRGSAYMYSAAKGLHSDYRMALSDSIMTSRGVLLGFTQTDGIIPSGVNNEVTVSVRLSVARSHHDKSLAAM